jgi:hypothetical protein
MKRLGLIVAWALPVAVAAQGLPPLPDEMLKQASAVLHVDVKTGRLAGITDRGPVAEVGAKVVEVMFGDYKADEWIAYTKPVQGEYVKPAVSQRLLVLGREGHRAPLVDADFSPQARDALVQRLAEYRRNRELLTGEMHVPDYLLRSAANALLHGEVTKTTLFERGRGYLSATHVAKVVGVAQGDFKPGQTIEYVEESPRQKRFDPNANPQRIVLLHYTRSVQDGQMRWWLHERVNHGFTEAGFRTLQADLARVRASQSAVTSAGKGADSSGSPEAPRRGP